MSASLIVATILKWTPFILQGFLLNVVISVIAISVGTLLGTFLGFGQIAHGSVARVSARAVTPRCSATRRGSCCSSTASS